MFSNQRGPAQLQGTLLCRADVRAYNADDQVLLRRFEFIGPPGILFFDCKGGEIAFRVIGYQSAEQFVVSLASVYALR